MTVTDTKPPAQVKEEIEARRAIDTELWRAIKPVLASHVLRLASCLNSDLPCEFFRPRIEGAYNLCFFVLFPSTSQRWVVRLAKTKPLAYSLTAKISAEVATMTVVGEQTTVPVPKVHSYSARKDDIREGLYGFIVMDFIEGETLGSILERGRLACNGRRESLTESDKEKLKAQMDGYYEQMSRVQFSSIGTLGFTGAEGHSCPRIIDVVRGPHSQTLNNNQILGYRPFSLHQGHLDLGGRLHSTRQYISFLFKDLLNLHCQKSRQLDSATSAGAEERSALYLLSLAWLHLNSAFPPPDANAFSDATPTVSQERFILSHADLNAGNILVSPTTLEITGILDWEWAKVIPEALDCRPGWYASLSPAASPDTSALAASHSKARDATAVSSSPSSPRNVNTLTSHSTLESLTKLLHAARQIARQNFAAENKPASPAHGRGSDDSFNSYLAAQVDDFFFCLPARREFLAYRMSALPHAHQHGPSRGLQQQCRGRHARVEEGQRGGAGAGDDNDDCNCHECCHAMQPDLAESCERCLNLGTHAEKHHKARLSTEDELTWLCHVVGFNE